MLFKEKVINLLKENMTEKGFKLWKGIDSILNDIWNMPTSSTGKWHKKRNGNIPSNAEHVYHMLYAAIKIKRLFNIKSKTIDFDKILIAIALHDSLKYGKYGNRKHTDKEHDKNAADMIAENKNIFLKLFSEKDFYIIEEAVRFHSGRWSTDAKYEKIFSFNNYNPETLFIHILDMMSTEDLIQTDIRE
jgi:hypothetical protein